MHYTSTLTYATATYSRAAAVSALAPSLTVAADELSSALLYYLDIVANIIT